MSSGSPTPVRAPDAPQSQRAPRWIYSAGTDTFLAWCWLPFFLVAYLLDIRGAGFTVGDLFAVVLLLSLVHQPLTLLLVYGDPRQFRLHRRLFVLAPLVAVAVLVVAVRLDLWLIVPVAAVWNTVHTVQQRYGLLRIYAGKAGYGSARLDRAVVYLPLLAVLGIVAVQDRTADQLDAIASTFGGNNSAGVRLLLDNRTPLLVALPVLLALALVTVARYIAQERNSPQAHPAKWGYLAGSAFLLVAVLVDPLAGLVAYVAAHALEYVVVVSRTLARRYPQDGGAPGPLAVVASGPVRRQVLLWGFLALLAAGVLVAREVLASRDYLVLIYTVGVLHFTFDAVIWKVRRPAVQADFGIPRPRT